MNKLSHRITNNHILSIYRSFSHNKGAHDILKNSHLVKSMGYINGKWTHGHATENFDVINPANSKVVASLPRMGVKDTKEAIQAAHTSWESWKNTTSFERSKILSKMSELMHKYKEELSAIITLEAGKPLAEARGELLYAISFYDYYAEEAKRVNGEVLQTTHKSRRILTIKQPIGPTALITPWNFPSAMITRKLGPALAAGCTAVLKPANDTPLSALALCAIAEEAGVPPGVVNCVTVAREEVEGVGQTLCHSKQLRKISFTGSTAVGKWLMREASSTVKRVSLELGGNAPFIVFDDADLNVALTALVNSKFRNAGQACIASNRILVQEGVYDKFAEMVASAVKNMKCGDGFHVDSTIGPLINQQGLTKVKFQF